MEEIGYVVGLVLAATFLWSAIQKQRTLDASESSFADLGIRAPRAALFATIGAEVLAAALLAIFPAIGAALAILLLVAFSVVLFRVIQGGGTLSCACFGASSSSPVSWVHLGRNGFLIAAAVFVLATT